MIQLLLSQKAVFCVIEPGNLQRLKEGRPLTIDLPNGSSVMIAFTPDQAEFSAHLGLHVEQPEPNTRRELVGVHITPEAVSLALKACQGLPEVLR